MLSEQTEILLKTRKANGGGGWTCAMCGTGSKDRNGNGGSLSNGQAAYVSGNCVRSRTSGRANFITGSMCCEAKSWRCVSPPEFCRAAFEKTGCGRCQSRMNVPEGATIYVACGYTDMRNYVWSSIMEKLIETLCSVVLRQSTTSGYSENGILKHATTGKG